jgi:lipopolysaccharide/colanic/teichoic acid biosynthesis glycosyltransferase
LTLECIAAHNSGLPKPPDPVAGRRHPALGLPKRVFDIVVSLALLVILSPLMLLAALLIVTTMGRPIFFKQERPGLGGRPFRHQCRRTAPSRDATC